MGVGGQDVGAVVAGSADLAGVGASVAAHEVADRVLEVAVAQGVELRQFVAQRLLLDPVPGLPLPVLADEPGRGHDRDGTEHDHGPHMGDQPGDGGPHCRDAQDAGAEDEDTAVVPA